MHPAELIQSAENQPLIANNAVGIGIRAQHFREVLDTLPDIPWFEALTDNYIAKGGPAVSNLMSLREYYPIALHGVQLSLASTDPLNREYLQQLKKLCLRLNPLWISEHLCWSSFNGRQINELAPVPFTETAVKHIANRIRQVQDVLEQRILVENISSYLTFKSSKMQEWEFINAIANEADCDLLLDINNIYVNATNHGFDAHTFIDAIDGKNVKEIHLGGYEEQPNGLLMDTHGNEVHEPVWQLYDYAMNIMGPRPTLIEWDNNLPALTTLLNQAQQAESVLHGIANDVDRN